MLVSRFLPIIRTCAPFVAGVGRMPYARFLGYNLFGGILWVTLFIWGGYLFGNIPFVKQNFGLVTLVHRRRLAGAGRGHRLWRRRARPPRSSSRRPGSAPAARWRR